MALEIEWNGKRVVVTKEQIFEAASTGQINPQTKVWVNGIPHAVGTIKGIQFPNANTEQQLPPSQQPSTPTNSQKLPPPGYMPRKKWAFIILAIFVYGAHNIYAGYIVTGIFQFLLIGIGFKIVLLAKDELIQTRWYQETE